MRLFDTHCHFETADAGEIAAIAARARAAGVERMMAVGGSAALNSAAVAAAKLASAESRMENGKRGDGLLPTVLCAIGFDREQVGRPEAKDVSAALGAQLSALDSRLPIPSCSAIGEIGLDYHYSPATRDAQRRLFAEQLEEARRRKLPVVIHTREADDDTLGLLREIPSRGIIHCFTGTPDAARRFLDLGFYISISGIVTFRAADNVRESALVVPDDRILVETDSPFLAPVPLRGRPNEPAFVRHVCEFLAALRKVSAEDFAELTFANAEAALGVDARAGNC